MKKTADRENLIGLSLAQCVIDICRGDIREDQVQKIIAATNHENLESAFDTEYKESSWKKFPEKAAKVAKELLAKGCISQPRCDQNIPDYPTEEGHSTQGYNWLDVNENKQFKIGDGGSRIYSDRLSEDVEAILQHEKGIMAKEILNRLRISGNKGGKGV